METHRRFSVPWEPGVATVWALSLMVALMCLACGAPPENQGTTTPSWRSESLSGVPGGFRATAYDPTRNELWILTRYFRPAGVPLVDLTRFDMSSGDSSSTLVGLSGQGFIKGSIAVDSAGIVWMSWGRTLFRYNPDVNSTKSWALPALPSDVRVVPEHAGLDGNVVSMAVDGTHIWVAVNSIEAVFRFDSIRSTWDEHQNLPLVPNLATRLTLSSSGELIVNGVDSSQTPAMAVISASMSVVELKTHATDYVVLTDGSVVYSDDQQNLIRLSSSAQASAGTGTGVPLAGRPNLAVDRLGDIWFSMSANKSVGVGEYVPVTGRIELFPFPRSATPPSGALTCPGPSFNCNSSLVFDPDVQSIVVDDSNNIWITTSVPGVGGDPNFAPPAAALYEFTGAG